MSNGDRDITGALIGFIALMKRPAPVWSVVPVLATNPYEHPAPDFIADMKSRMCIDDAMTQTMSPFFAKQTSRRCF